MKKDKQLEMNREQLAWRHNHEVNDHLRDDNVQDDPRRSNHVDNALNGTNGADNVDDAKRWHIDGQDLPDLIGRDALPRTPAVGAKHVEPDEKKEFDVRR